MSARGLQMLVGKAVVSDRFRVAVLNGRRVELLGDFDLKPEEVREVMAIQAETLAEFAAAVARIAHQVSAM